MGTTADIARINADGSHDFTHVSGDGYLAHTGAILLHRFSDEASRDILFGGDHIEEMLDDPAEIVFIDDERDPDWGWSLDEAGYVLKDGRWHYRAWMVEEDDQDGELLELTREAVLADAREYGCEDRIRGFLDGRHGIAG